MAQSCLLKAFFTWVDGVGFFDNVVSALTTSHWHSEHPQAAKLLFSSQTNSLAMTGHSRIGDIIPAETISGCFAVGEKSPYHLRYFGLKSCFHSEPSFLNRGTRNCRVVQRKTNYLVTQVTRTFGSCLKIAITLKMP